MSFRLVFGAAMAGARVRVGVLVIGLAVSSVHGQYDPPADYYTTADGLTGAALKSQLHLIISDNYFASLTGPGGTFVPNGSGHHYVSYDNLRQALPIVDADPNIPGNIILVYNGASVDGTWDSGVTYNREHRWPASWGLGSSGYDYSDMHMVAPCNPSINSWRSNLPFGHVGSSGGYGVYGSYFYPGDNDQPDPQFGDDTGDSARAMFYMAVRYDGVESNTEDLELRDGTYGLTGGIWYGADLASLLKWHYEDTPSDHERSRNERIFSTSLNPYYYQGNRNAFVDRPEWVWSLFVDNANDTQLHLGSPDGDGASSVDVDLGRLMVGQAVPGSQQVTLFESGSDGTYYSVTPAGDGTSDVTGSNNAFEMSVTGSQAIEVGLNSSTATSGLKSGTVTIDNLDITNGGGAGHGANDADDVIDVHMSVVEDRVINATAVDFGEVIVSANPNQTTTLSTSGDDDHFTRVTVLNAITSDGVVTVTTDAMVFSADAQSDTAQVAATFASTGSYGSSVGLSEANGALQGEALAGETVQPVDVQYAATVLAHATASFDSNQEVSTIAVDFGTVAKGSTPQPVALNLYNLESVTGFTAGLDLDSIDSSGDDAVLTTNLGTFSDLAAGSAEPFEVAVDTASAGIFSATYTLEVSDEDLPGELGGSSLTLTITATVGSADLDSDGDVDGDDFLTFSICFNGSLNPPLSGCVNTAADLDGDGDVDGVDFVTFSTCFNGSLNPPQCQ